MNVAVLTVSVTGVSVGRGGRRDLGGRKRVLRIVLRQQFEEEVGDEADNQQPCEQQHGG